MTETKAKSLVKAFTLIEILTVIAIILVLAAILFPVFSRAKASAKQTTCLSNLRQIGGSIALYQSGYDGFFPFACDVFDKVEPGHWNFQPEWEADISSMPLIKDILHPYLRSNDVFHCPSDTGTDIVDDTPDIQIPSSPSLFAKYGSSYTYRTLLAFEALADAQLKSPAGTNVLYDATGAWHGNGRALENSDFNDMQTVDSIQATYRYDTLFADGHCKLLPFADLQKAASTAP